MPSLCRDYFFLCMELITGGELFDRICEKGWCCTCGVAPWPCLQAGSRAHCKEEARLWPPSTVKVHPTYSKHKALARAHMHSPALLPAEKYSEREARVLMYQLASGIAYAHAKGIAHRDLKVGHTTLSLTRPRTGAAQHHCSAAQGCMQEPSKRVTCVTCTPA